MSNLPKLAVEKDFENTIFTKISNIIEKNAIFSIINWVEASNSRSY